MARGAEGTMGAAPLRGEGCGGGGMRGQGRGRRSGPERHRREGGMARGMHVAFGGWRPEDREDQIRRLEELQRDLEQRAADMADLVGRLRQEPVGGESPVAG